MRRGDWTSMLAAGTPAQVTLMLAWSSLKPEP